MSSWITGNETIPPMYLFDTPGAVERCIIEDYDNGVAEVTLMREYYPTEHYKFDIPNLTFNGARAGDSAKETIDKMWNYLSPAQRFMLIKSLGTLIIEPAETPAVEKYPTDYLYTTPDAVQRIDLVEFKDDILKIALIHNNFDAEYHDIEIAKLKFHTQDEGTSAKQAIDVLWDRLIPVERLELIQALGRRVDVADIEDPIDEVSDQIVNDIAPDFEDELELAYWDFDTERKGGSRSERDIFKSKVRYLVSKAI